MNLELLNKYIGLIDKGYCEDCNELNCISNFPHKEIAKNIKIILEENQELKKQLEYLRSGEYLNQLKFERNMLQDVVDDMEVAPEDKAFIDCTHRNTELLAQQKEFIQWLENEIQKQKDYGASFGLTIDRDIAEYISEKITVYKDVLSKYKEAIGGDK